LSHPHFIEHADPRWLEQFVDGYAGYPQSWSLAARQINKELVGVGWDVDSMLDEIRAALEEPEFPAPPPALGCG
jgi:hypothetical protein